MKRQTPPAGQVRSTPPKAAVNPYTDGLELGNHLRHIDSIAAEAIQLGPVGTTRIRRYVVERPVEETVTLRGERVTVEKRQPLETTGAPAAKSGWLRFAKPPKNRWLRRLPTSSKRSLWDERPPNGPRR